MLECNFYTWKIFLWWNKKVKINNFERTVEYISSKGILEPNSILMLGAIIFILLGLEFFIFRGSQKIGSVFLLLFLIRTTIIIHVFSINQKIVLINLGLIDGLIIAAASPK